jgi:hypothetical protein
MIYATFDVVVHKCMDVNSRVGLTLTQQMLCLLNVRVRASYLLLHNLA